MVVGTFPGPHFVAAGIRCAVPVEFFDPIPVDPVHHPCLDIVPTPPGRLCKALLPGELVGIIESHHGLGLHPPALIAVHQTLRARLVGQAAVLLQAILVYGRRNPDGGLTHLFHQRRVTLHFGSFTSSQLPSMSCPKDIFPSSEFHAVVEKELEVTG